ncbi:proteoglycan 4-like [Mangifera indica]|uniref:proteoglycan 4-like n=1 Tax=Mangifera indica TaxID=29780 RepID=UPI001CFA3C81|nr:proteoglycan 4-like [Mangifera indica]
MAEQRQTFRFRLPWLSAPRPAQPQIPRPSEPQVQAPSQPTTTTTTTTPPQRPPFRPAGIAPSQPPLPVPRTEPPAPPEPQSLPSRAANESRVVSQPASPARATQTRAASVPPSPSRGSAGTPVSSQLASPTRATTQTQITSQTKSPSRTTTQARATSVPPSPSRTTSQTQSTTQASPQPQSSYRSASRTTGQTSQPSSPMHKAPQVQPIARAVSQPPSPPKKSEPVPQQTSRPPLSLIQPPSSVPREQEPKPIGSRKPSQEQPKMQIKSEIVSESQYQAAATLKRDRLTTQAAQASDGVATVVPASMAELEKVFSKIEEKKDAEESLKEGKPENGKKNAVHQVKEEKTVDDQTWKALPELTVASGSGTEIRESLVSTFQTEEKKQEEQEISNKQKPLSTSNSDEKQIKTVSSTHLKDRSTRGDIHQKAPLHKDIKDDILKFTHRLTLGNSKQTLDRKPVSMITLAGENRGASMLLGSESTKKDGSIHIHRGYKINSNENRESTTDGEGSCKEKIPKGPVPGKDQATKVYINSNVQSINNSILFESSLNERNPGVQLDFSHNQAEHTKPTIQQESMETSKAQFSITPVQNLTYQPVIRRRCLRGLFMEPSDSDPDNPEKPRRHGCLYNCGEKSKDKERGPH